MAAACLVPPGATQGGATPHAAAACVLMRIPVCLALRLLQYRARQKRLVANSSKSKHDRSRVLREVEEALKRWAPVWDRSRQPGRGWWHAWGSNLDLLANSATEGGWPSIRAAERGHSLLSPPAPAYPSPCFTMLLPAATAATAPARCKELFPEDGRSYVSLGKLYVQQRRYDEALALYEEGCTATGVCIRAAHSAADEAEGHKLQASCIPAVFTHGATIRQPVPTRRPATRRPHCVMQAVPTLTCGPPGPTWQPS